MTGAGYRIETDASEIEKNKKGSTVEAKQGIFYQNVNLDVVKAKNFSTQVVWKAAVEGEENDGSSATLIPATLGAIGFAYAALAF